MADELNDLSAPQAISSVVLDERKHEEQPKPLDDFDAPEEKKGSVRDAIAKAFDEVAGKDEGEPEEGKAKPKVELAEKPDVKAKADEEPKPEKARGEDGKFAKAEKPEDARGEKSATPEKEDAGTGQEKDQRRPSEGRHPEPPARFLPKEREAWANVPNVVKSGVERMAREHEQEVAQYRESHENWQKLDKFNQMAKQHNTSISDALERYTAVDALLHNNPIEGIRRVLETVGITPQQYAEFVTKNPQAASQPPVQRAPDPVIQRTSHEVQELRQQIEDMRLQQAAERIIEPFRRDHPRYDELQGDIEFFLRSGKIPQSLSPNDRLEAAYDMAERINPRSMPAAYDERREPVPVQHEEPVVDPRGGKSIKGAPSGGFDPAEHGRSKTRRAAIDAAMASMGA